MKEPKTKYLYKGVFNWKGEIYTKYVYAYSEDQAFRLICKLISQDMNLRNDIDIRHYFWGTVFFEITKVKEVKKNAESKITEASSYQAGT